MKGYNVGHWCRFSYLHILVVSCFLVHLTICTKRKGDHEKLGAQLDPSVETDEFGAKDVPQPEVFYEQYVRENRPVVFRGAAKSSKAYQEWTEAYLIEKYGNLTVRLEARAEINSNLPKGAIALGLDLLSNFIKNYQKLDGYIISQIPEPMEQDVMILPCLRCGSFARSIQEVHLFLSASGGKTALHKDPYNNIHCVFNGTKDWILIHPNQTESVYMSKGSHFEWGGLSKIDVDDVDLGSYPKIADVEYSKVRLHKGDCIFMPAGYWHQVRSFGHMNSAVAIWFSFLDNFDDSGCKGKTFNYTPLNEVDILWRYSGFGDLTQGHMDIYVLQKTLLLWADANDVISLHTFVDHFFVLLRSNARRRAMAADIRLRRKKFIRYLDTTGDGSTTKEKVRSLSVDQLKSLVELIHPNDISNTDKLEYGHLDIEYIRAIIKGSLYKDGRFDEDWFIEHYTEELGGTLEKGKQILSALEIPKGGKVTWGHILSRMEHALEKYSNALIHDPATEKRIFQFLHSNAISPRHDEF